MITSLQEFKKTYETRIETVKIGDYRLEFFRPKQIDRFINPDDLLKAFPLWAKMWEASAVLAGYMADLPADPGRRILEIGAGLGVAGITAAAHGHQVCLTEHDSHALDFLQANVWLNNCQTAQVQRLDWTAPSLTQHFDMVIGSEVIYKSSDIAHLLALFRRYLPQDGRVVLAEAVRRTGLVFFERLSPLFDIQTRKHTMRSADSTQTVLLFEMHWKNKRK